MLQHLPAVLKLSGVYMSTEKLYHYTYRITNLLLNKHYIGCRSSALPPKEDLGVKYFSSSSDKEFRLDQKINPHNYRYKVIKTYTCRQDAINLEIKLHNKLNVGANLSFYNKSKQTSSKFDMTGFIFSEETKLRFSESRKGRTHSEEAKERMRKSCAGRYIGRKLTEEHKANIAKSHTGMIRSEEAKARMSAAQRRKDNPTIKPANVYNYYTNELIAEGVSLRAWCRENSSYDYSAVRKTAAADRTAAHHHLTNPHRHKDIYAVYL